jgi:hypothetical protein
MKKLLMSAILSFTAVSVSAADITTVAVGPPGGGMDLFALPMAGYLKDRGWNVTQRRFPDCRSAQEWLRRNSDQPVMLSLYLDDAVLTNIDADHPRACPGINLDQDSVVTVISKVYHSICSMGELGYQELKSMPNPKIASFNHPVQYLIVQDIMKDLGVNARIVNLRTAGELFGSLKSGDVDFMVVSYDWQIKQMGGTCFLTQAPIEVAATMSDFKTDKPRVSIEEVVASPTRIGTGLTPIYISYNVDIDALRKDVVEILKTAEEYQKMYETAKPAGLVAGQTPQDQWQEITDYINTLK